MRKLLTILMLGCSVLSMALVPPRDPSQWDEWRQNVYSRQLSELRRAPAATQALGTPTLIPRILVIMANFSNYELISTKADVDSMFNGYNWTKEIGRAHV